MSDRLKQAREYLMNYSGPRLRVMEVCGTHTHEIFRLGLRQLLPDQVKVISGPGCPVCVTPADFIDEAILMKYSEVVIVHGIGSGIVKEAVHCTLSRRKDIVSYHLLSNNIGCTIVKIDRGD